MRKTKVIISQINNLVKLLDEAEDIFHLERPYIEDLTLEKTIIPLDERRLENEIKIKKTVQEIGFQLANKLPEETSQDESKGISVMVNPIKVVINKPLYNDFVTIRDTYLNQAKKEGRKLLISSPNQGECLVSADKWIETGKRMEKEFLIKGNPMVLYGNNISRFTSKLPIDR